MYGPSRIVAAGLYSATGNEFARYVRDGQIQPIPAHPGPDRVQTVDGDLILVRPVFLDGRRLGTLHVRMDLADLDARISRYAAIVVGVLLASILAALLLSSLLQRVVSRPILALAKTAGRVSVKRDYSIRVVPAGDDEVGTLGRRFNEMMSQIQRRDQALRRAQDRLEERVAERTREIETEIAERKRIQGHLVRAMRTAEGASRAKSVFLANMSHELRTPLNAIIGYSELLEEEALDADQQTCASDLRKIRTAGRHLLTLINDLLDLSKVEAGHMELHIEPVAIGELIDEARNTANPLAATNGNQFRVEVEDRERTIYLDLTRFRQSLFNLLSNACKFTENGTVTLEVEPQRIDDCDWVDWHVRDTGIGIARDDQPKLFQAFSQVDASNTRQHGGTGLGLAISQRFCQMMGGEITVDSEPGQGSTFTIRLPADCRPDGEESPASDAPTTDGEP